MSDCAKGTRKSSHGLSNPRTTSLLRILPPSHSESAEESILYFGAEQNLQNFETANGSDKNGKKFWVALIYVRSFQNSNLSNRSNFTIPAFYSVVVMTPNQAFSVAIAVLLPQITAFPD